MAAGLKGLDKLLRTLNTTRDKTTKKCARAGTNAGLTALTKAMRAAVNSTPASSAIKRAARKAIGKSLKASRGTGMKGIVGGKAGFSVGKQSKKKREAAKARSMAGGGGVGISAANIHWFVLGTDDRYHKSGHPTGKIEDVLKGVVPSATMAARGDMLEAARKKITQVLARETAKARK